MEFVRRAAVQFARLPAIGTIVAEGGSGPPLPGAWVDYASLVRRAERVAASLPGARASGAAAPVVVSTPAGNAAVVGPRVAVWAQPGPEFVAALYACFLSGAVAVPLSPRQPAAQLEGLLEDCGASALLAPERLLLSSLPSSSSSSSSGPSARRLLEGLSAARRIPLVAVEDVEAMAKVMGTAEAAAAAAAAAVPASDEQDGERQRWRWRRRRRRAGEEAGAVEAEAEASHAPSPAVLILYTSGSTGRPKGVVHSSSSLLAQADGLSRAWRVTASDRVLHALPLHHVHGLVNALLSPLSSGARVRFLLPRFSARGAWEALAAEDAGGGEGGLVFHGVPTMYSMMLDELDAGGGRQQQEREGGDKGAAGEEDRAAWAARGLAAARDHARLFVCGSAACPPSLWLRWRQETGHALLERYGMTETGMVLSNLLGGEGGDRGGGGDGGDDWGGGGDHHVSTAPGARRPGCVGLPLPGVDVRLVPLRGAEAAGGGGSSGGSSGSAQSAAAAKPLTVAEALALEESEQDAAAAGARKGHQAQQRPERDPPAPFYVLRVRGPSLFSGYWRRDDATREAFAGGGGGGAGGGGGGDKGFFDTGDVVAFDRGGGETPSSSSSSHPYPRYLRVVGRASADVIKSRGFKLSALDVEAALLQLQSGAGAATSAAAAAPLVSECAVFGVPDARFEGEELVAALVRVSPAALAEAEAEAAAAAGNSGDDEGRRRQGAADAAARALARGVAALVAPYAVPKLWLLLTPDRAIPRNAMGKVNKRALRSALLSGGNEEGSGSGGSPGARWVAADADAFSSGT